jgi:hypothetical protein
MDGEWVEVEAEDSIDPILMGDVDFQNVAFDVAEFEQHAHATHLGPVINYVGTAPMSGPQALQYAIDQLSEEFNKHVHATGLGPTSPPLAREEQVGWECPKCGACFAPSVTRCENCVGSFNLRGAAQTVISDPIGTPVSSGTIIINPDHLSGTVEGWEWTTAVDLNGDSHNITSETTTHVDNSYVRDSVYFTSQSEHLLGSIG